MNNFVHEYDSSVEKLTYNQVQEFSILIFHTWIHLYYSVMKEVNGFTELKKPVCRTKASKINDNVNLKGMIVSPNLNYKNEFWSLICSRMF